MFLKIAHRGNSKNEPENTLRSFSSALKAGANMIECDVHFCKTGELVVIHDATVDRTTNGRGAIHKKNYSELLELDAGRREHVPKLQEVIELIDKKARLNIELKGKGTGWAVAIMLQIYYGAGWTPSDFIVSSFSRRELKHFKNIDKKTPISYLISWNTFGAIRFAKKIGAISINPHIKKVNKDFVERAHQNKLKVFVYTVNTKEEVSQMKKMGVDGVFSDCFNEI